MAQASARRTFHGPLLAVPQDSRRPPSTSSLGRAVLQVARAEQPSTDERERILAGVLAALRRLTGANQ
ncbi:MAG TPA: hypothetical protein VHB79_17665 [Polyangiaceae bacterium]|nr:hypothetical protein [Polyangiaceae bacterium]